MKRTILSLVGLAVGLIAGQAASPLIGPESAFTQTLKTNTTAVKWKSALRMIPDEVLTNIYATNISVGLIEAFTVPTNKSARMPYLTLSGGPLGASNFTTYLFLKTGGVYYPVSSANTTTNGTTAPLSGQTRIFQSGDTLVLSNLTAGISAKWDVWTWDKSDDMYESRITGFTTGYDVLYTVPTNKTSSGWSVAGYTSNSRLTMTVGLANYSGGTRTYYIYIVPPGETADATKVFRNNVTVANGSSTGMQLGSLSSGYSIAVRSDSTNSGQMAFTAVLEE